jgi:bifunctional DNA-binding transcriptional regulator/antitoxin component of YhaV-PrlF toxin-antitoxin module
MQSPRDRYNEILEKYESIRANLHIIEADKLDESVAEIEKYELIMKQLEDLYGEELM